MKKSLKIAGIVIGVLLVLFIAAIIVVPMVVDPNAYKDRIVALVEKQTGRHMKIEGDIALSVFPWLGLKLGAVELGNAQGFEAASFARIEELQIRVRIIPLLSSQVEADVVTVRGLTVNLERDKKGRTNWDDLVKTEPEKQPQETKKQATGAAALAVGGVDIRDGSLTWTDRVSGQHYRISDLSVSTSAVTLVDPVDVKIGFQADTGAVGLNGRVETRTRLHVNLKDKVYKIENLQIEADLQGKMLPGGRAALNAGADIEFAAEPGRLKLTGVKLEADGLSLPPHTAGFMVETEGTGDLASQVFELPALKVVLSLMGNEDRITANLTAKVRADLKAQQVAITNLALSLPECSVGETQVELSPPQPASITMDLAGMTVLLEGFKISGTVSGKALPGGPTPVSFGFRAHADLNRETASLDGLLLEALGIKVAGKFAATQLKTEPQIAGNMTVSPFNPREIFGRVAKELPPMADPSVMTFAEMTATLNGSTDRISIDTFRVRLDDTQVEGSLGVHLKPAPTYAFDLRVDSLDADRYLPSPKKDAAAAAATPGAATAALPLEPLRALNLDGKLVVEKLKISNVRMQDIRMQAVCKDGVLNLNPLSAGLYGGTYQGNVTADARGDQLRIVLDEKLSNVQVGPLLKDFQGRALLTGLTRAGMKLSAVGADADAITRTLNGTVDFEFTDGSIEGMDIVGQVCRALAGLGSGGSLKKEDIVSGVLQIVTQKVKSDEIALADRTTFSELRGSMAFTDGIGACDGLTLKSPLLRVEAKGKMDLPQQILDYQATVALVKSCEGQGGKALGDLSNLPIPVAISGPFQDVSVRPDLGGIIQQLVERRKAKTEAPAAPQPEQPPAQETASPSQQQPSQQPEQQKAPKEQVEDAVKDVLQKGLQDLFQKQ